MHVAFVSSEAVPFAKTGGLADVASGLSKALAAMGHEVLLLLPCYRRQIPESRRGQSVGRVQVEMQHQQVSAQLLETTLDSSKVRVILIDQPNFFDRASLYTESGYDYFDNAARFLFFSQVVLKATQALGFTPDVIHANDWQTALIPALLDHDRQTFRQHRAASVLTIHNMAFQGLFPRNVIELAGIPTSYFDYRRFEYYGKLNLLKGGITLADIVTTVSPTYAREICRPEFGCGLDGVLAELGDRLAGILNGVDVETWNPATDRLLPGTYNVDSFATGKAAAKRELQKEMHLPDRPGAMILGMVSRLTDQKGLDLIAAKVDAILSANVQLVFLGTGDNRYEGLIRDLQHHYPDKVGAKIGFNESLSHLIEAGSDAFLMPSRFEPCGLNQMYSLAYGTPPIVHAVGGLADSVTDATSETMGNGQATGFVFRQYDPDAFLDAVWRAVGMYFDDREGWNRLVRQGMQRDVSWTASAREYTHVYERAIAHAVGR